MEGLSIYNGKKVLVTGHTGFKGSWLTIWLNGLGAKVIGVSLKEWDNDFVFRKTKLHERVYSNEAADINDHDRLAEIFARHKPDFVFHLAAQPIVRKSYDQPAATIRTNITGTTNVLECIRNTPSIKAAVMITTDKCYKNKEQRTPYKESDELGGHDPYSASKACAEIIIESYRNSFFKTTGPLVASVRAGNVLGGGDYGEDRLVPDCIRALNEKRPIEIRNPYSVRPWQFILDPLRGYLLVGARLLSRQRHMAEGWNFGPEESSIITVKELVEKLVKEWGSGEWKDKSNTTEIKHEAKLLYLDIEKARSKLDWRPLYGIDKTLSETVKWYKESNNLDAEKLYEFCTKQIDEHCSQNL
jgi:CDP-glucose 4,6-dehydratase